MLSGDIETSEAPYAGSVINARESVPRKETEKSRSSPEGLETSGVVEMEPPRPTG